MKNKNKIISVLVVSFISALIVRTFIFEGFIVVGESMSPTINNFEYVFINRLAYYFREPRRGDIIIVVPREIKQKILKRVVGLPGEIISIENGKVEVRQNRDDIALILEEKYLKSEITPENGITRINLDPQEYFAMGDNREVSIDSRELGSVDRWDIKGRVFASFNLKDLKLRLF